MRATRFWSVRPPTRSASAPSWHSTSRTSRCFVEGTATTKTYTLSLHDALPIFRRRNHLRIPLLPPVIHLAPPHRPPRYAARRRAALDARSEEHTSELQSQSNLVCRLLLEKKNRRGRRAAGAGRCGRLGSGQSDRRRDQLRLPRGILPRVPRVALSKVQRPPRPTLFPYTTLFRSFAGETIFEYHSFPPSSTSPRRTDHHDTPRDGAPLSTRDRKSTRLNSSHSQISYAVFCLKKKIGEAGAQPEPGDAGDSVLVSQTADAISFGSLVAFYLAYLALLCRRYSDHQDLHSFPTRRSSDLSPAKPSSNTTPSPRHPPRPAAPTTTIRRATARRSRR